MNRLHEIRFFKKLSQHKLALLARVHQSRISLIENRLIEPREDEKRRLAKALRVKAEEVFPLEARKVGTEA